MRLYFADLLDYTRNTFDRDFLEFNVNVAELETALQGFINASFENITSTEHALNLLKQFEAILQRDTLKSDLDSKYIVIFHNYGLDLETVQKIYDKQVIATFFYSLECWHKEQVFRLHRNQLRQPRAMLLQWLGIFSGQGIYYEESSARCINLRVCTSHHYFCAWAILEHACC
jgi:hypothetical protein